MPNHAPTPQLLGHIDSARCIAHPDGRWSIRIEGWLTNGSSGFVVVQAGIPDEPIVMLTTVPRPDLRGTFSSLPAESTPGFVGNIPCSSPRVGRLSITFLALLPSGTTTAFSIETVVTLGESQTRESFAGSAESLPAGPTRILFMTDVLDSPSNRTQRYLNTIRELAHEGFAVTLFETERIGSSEQTPRMDPLPSRVTCLSTKHAEELDRILQQHLPSYDVIWVTQPGGLRLLDAVYSEAQPKIIFDPSITLSDDVLASTSELRVEHHVFSSESHRATEALVRQQTESVPDQPPGRDSWIDIRLSADREVERVSTRGHRNSCPPVRTEKALESPFRMVEKHRIASCDDQIGAVYPLPWFVALANSADLVVVPDDQSASRLRELGVARVRTMKATKSSVIREALASTLTRSKSPGDVSNHGQAHAVAAPRLEESFSQNVMVDIIVPIYNAARELSDCLDALRHNTDLPSHLILVDDHSDDPRIEDILSSLPNQLQETSIRALTIIYLNRNAGFSGAVNLGLAAGASPFVVLLNSDTLPPPQWLSRLIAPLKADSSIGSVTPLSNSATICSFRSPFESEQGFDPIALLQTDSLFARHGSKEPITIPTGVGFCLASRRSVYTQIGFLDADLFRKMYGEECDWCMRVIRAGLRNVAITNLFIPHVDGASAKDANVNRQELLARCTGKLRTLHPDFYPSVEEFVRRDPLEPIRNFMHLMLLRENARPPATLYVHNPELAGGSSRYLDQLLARRSREGEALILAATSQETFLQPSLHDPRERIAIDAYMGDDARFRELLATFNIQEIVVNQLVGSAYDDLTERIRKSGVPYTVHLHDFFFACPTITLIGHTGRYCGGETRASECSACLSAFFEKSPDTSPLSITAWREHSYEFLSNASAVITVSEHTRNIYQRYFPDLVIRVEEPLVESPLRMRTINDSAIVLPILNVAVIGAIGRHKGSDLVYEMVDMLKNRALPIKLVVCGYTDRHSEPYIDQNGFFEVTGRYHPSELPNLLARHRIAFALLPSIWPETFLYTASEAMACGYPIMVSGLTAAAERVSEREAGWILNDLTAAGIITEIERLFYNRQEISDKTQNLLSAESATGDRSAPMMMATQHPFKDLLVEL